jgi:hypothetical protein
VPSGDSVEHDRERQGIHFCGGGPQPSDAFYRRNAMEPSADGDTEKQESLRWTAAELMRLGAAIAAEAEAETRGEALPDEQRWEAELHRIRTERKHPHAPTPTIA